MLADETSDPAYELFESIRSKRKPTLAWIVKWSESGEDSANAAWRTSRHEFAMRKILALLGFDVYSEDGKFRRDLYCGDTCDATHCVRCCDAIRGFAPKIPTIEEIIGRISRA